MKPYYQDSAVTIYHGDCREVLPRIPDLCHVAITDPPYGINGGSGGINKGRAKGNYQACFTDDSAYIAATVVPVVMQLIARCIAVIVTPGSKNLTLYPSPQSFGVFYQPASIGMQVFGAGDAQPILYYGKNATQRNMGCPCSYVLTESPPENGHPCPKPFIAWKRLLGNMSLPSHTVIDPFMGSGTTLRAAKDLGRKAIGVEIDERYCEIAAKRMEQECFDFCPVKVEEQVTPLLIPEEVKTFADVKRVMQGG